MSRFSTFFAQVFSGKGRSLKWEALLQIIWVLVGTAIFVCTSRPTPPIQLFLHLFHLILLAYSLFLRLLLLLLLIFSILLILFIPFFRPLFLFLLCSLFIFLLFLLSSSGSQLWRTSCPTLRERRRGGTNQDNFTFQTPRDPQSSGS